MEKKVLFLNPPSFEGFDGGAGSRYQAKREVRSFWYPTWLAQAAAFLPDSRLFDAPVEGKSVAETIQAALGFDLVVIYTSTGGFLNDAKLTRRFREQYPDMMLAMVGPHTTVLAEETLRGCDVLDFVTRGEFDNTISDIANGRLNLRSPLARALIGKEQGDSVEVVTPGGRRSYEVLAVRFV